MDSTEFIDALNQIEKEKGIDKEIIFEAIESSLVSACKKNFGTSQNVKVVMDRVTGNIEVYAQKDVVEVVEDENLQVSIQEAKILNKNYELGDVVDFLVTPKDFGRISAQTAKQVVVQKFREAEREILYNQYISKEKDIVTCIVQRTERKNVIVQLGKIDAILTPSEQIPGEMCIRDRYRRGHAAFIYFKTRYGKIRNGIYRYGEFYGYSFCGICSK